jgi:hypothetical protein
VGLYFKVNSVFVGLVKALNPTIITTTNFSIPRYNRDWIVFNPDSLNILTVPIAGKPEFHGMPGIDSI